MVWEREVGDHLFGSWNRFGMKSHGLFGGMGDPFDDPFFTEPIFGMLPMFRSKWPEPPASFGVAQEPQTIRSRGIIIEELSSNDGGELVSQKGDEKNVQQSPTGSNNHPTVQHPDDSSDEDENQRMNHREDQCQTRKMEPQTHNFGFRTSRVTYGGVDGAYHTSMARRSSIDGVVVEEYREADKRTGEASHRISRGIHDKGHSVIRKLNPDGHVDTTQALHNLNEDELVGFEKAWKSNVKDQCPRRIDQFGFSHSKPQEKVGTSGLGWAHAYGGRARNLMRGSRSVADGKVKEKIVRINIE